VQQLSGLDGAFLTMESGTVFGHVGSVCILDTRTARHRLTLRHVTRVIESRLPLVPLFRRKLVTVPLGLDQPYWVDDPDFDIEFHVRSLALPSPGSDAQLAEQVAALHARPLDRSRPLWELYLITGLSDRRAAIYSKIHHAAIDGVSGGDVMTAVLDLTPEGRPAPEEEPFQGEARPGAPWLLGRSAATLAMQPLRATRLATELARSVPGLAVAARPLAERIARGHHPALMSGAGLRAPVTPFNGLISAHRRWATADLPLAEVKEVRRGTQLTVNDVVMALCAGTLRRYLAGHDSLPRAPLVAAVPVSVRRREQAGSYGNKISLMLTALPTQLEDPVERLRVMHRALRVAKDQHGAIPAGLLGDVSEFAMPVLANQAWRMTARLRLFERVTPFNLIVSNVPGPSVPLYFAGAELLAIYPVSAITDGQALNITVMSYAGSLRFGLVACREICPDLGRMAQGLRLELDALLESRRAAAEVPGAEWLASG
jgi:WS/DGAT/MGAT family acyltransferase